MSQLTHAVRRSPRRARLTAAAVLVALAAFMLVWIGRASADEAGPAVAFHSFSDLATGRADTLDAYGEECTPSSSFSDMPNMSKTFHFGGMVSRPVLVFFQAEWWGPANGATADVQLTIDGLTQGGRHSLPLSTGQSVVPPISERMAST